MKSTQLQNSPRSYSNRACFLIDEESEIPWSHVEPNNGRRRENSEILAAIKLLS
jgi:alkyl hydroperoxide reductase subunit AhpC